MAEKLAHSAFDYTIVEINGSGRAAIKRTKRISGHVVGDCFLFQEIIESTDQVSVYGRNERYEFALSRTGNSPWLVNWQSTRRDSDTPVGSAFAYLDGMLQLPWSISATPLEKLVCDPRFTIRSVQSQGKNTIKIAFAVAPTEHRPDDLQGLSSGTIVVDPTHHWAIQHYDAKYTNKISSSVTLAYKAPGPPDLRRVDFALTLSPTKTDSFSIDSIQYDWNPAEPTEFTLPAFGLPDFQESSNTPRRLIFVNLGIVCVLVGLIIYRRKQRLHG